MKAIFFLILLISINFCNAQTIEGIVKDSVTGKSIAYANIVLDSGNGTYSDEFGSFQIKLKSVKNDTLKVSTIGYTSKLLPVSKFKENLIYNVLLNPKPEDLDEVLIFSKKLKYGKKETLGEKRDGNIGVTSIIGMEKAVFIANPKNKAGKVNGVYVNLKKRKNAEYIVNFNVKFYQYDSITNTPGKLLYNENLYVQPKNKKYRLWIDVKDFDIQFPKNGICVSVEMVNTVGKVKKYTYFGPMYRYTFAETRVLKTWSNYHNRGWKDGYIEYKKFKRFKEGIANPMIGVEVEYILE